MDKVLLILPDNNKGKFISKGFSAAFNELAFFVFEKKIYDLNIEEVKKISPDIIFIFWSGLVQKDILIDFFENYVSDTTITIHCAELKREIPEAVLNKANNYIFTQDSNDKKSLYFPSVNAKDYKTKFSGYKYSLTFAGNPAYIEREKILASLIYEFGHINIFCRSFDFYKSVDEIYKQKLLNEYNLELYKNSYKGYVSSQKELAEIFVSSKINIDMENKNNKPLNYRCLEIMASGGFLLAPYNTIITKYFDDGKEFETYKSISELTDKINFYLQNLNIANLIAAKGRKNTVSNNSFYDKLKVILRLVYDKNIGNR